MNEDTRVAVCCYAGDRQQVVNALDIYLHHDCPLVVLSPEDSKVEIPDVETRFGGERCYIGEKAITRMREHLKILLTFPENFFLIHDADSFCLTPKLPDYLYAEPDLLWTNLKLDDIPQQQAFYPEGFPHIALHPPWFMSRKTIEGLLAVADGVTPNPEMLFIDYWLIQLAIKAGLHWKGFPEAVSFPTYDPFFAGAAWDAVRYRGTTFVHAVKTRETLMCLMHAHKLYNGDHS
jgi:hypothetical protein